MSDLYNWWWYDNVIILIVIIMIGCVKFVKVIIVESLEVRLIDFLVLDVFILRFFFNIFNEGFR